MKRRSCLIYKSRNTQHIKISLQSILLIMYHIIEATVYSTSSLYSINIESVKNVYLKITACIQSLNLIYEQTIEARNSQLLLSTRVILFK